MSDRILVLSVDRDDDIGSKTKIKGPVIGKKAVLETATALGLADPEDSDFNALFQAIKVYDELKKKHDVEVAVLTGHKNVGLTSDKIISEQLEHVMHAYNADYAILVTDGTEDEHVTPVIQSKIPIMSVNRVVVKQAEQLESTYYKIKDFIHESADNPRFTRLIFGLPSIILLLFAVFGVEGFRVILGLLGAYLFIKGFKLEDYVYKGADELKTSLERRRFAFFAYMVGFVFAALATYWGYTNMTKWVSQGLFEMVSSYISSSVFLYYVSLSMFWVGRNLSLKKRRGRNIVSVILFGFAVSLVVYNAAELILQPDISLFNFIVSIVAGFALIFVALLMEWRA